METMDSFIWQISELNWDLHLALSSNYIHSKSTKIRDQEISNFNQTAMKQQGKIYQDLKQQNMQKTGFNNGQKVVDKFMDLWTSRAVNSCPYTDYDK